MFGADKIFMFDMDKHYIASKLTIDMSVYIGPTYTMYIGRTLFQCYSSNMSYCKLAQHCANMLALQWPKEQVNVDPTLFYNVGPCNGVTN